MSQSLVGEVIMSKPNYPLASNEGKYNLILANLDELCRMIPQEHYGFLVVSVRQGRWDDFRYYCIGLAQQYKSPLIQEQLNLAYITSFKEV